ncbi:MAG TPA: heme-binding domain-containing protein [Ferruginibacter sp.]|nr:heme-binding domain-containing protein [Ferruginibacter sp.]HMP19394.1 heme-binding domain-containing protein [Ferruginibacter sp.]
MKIILRRLGLLLLAALIIIQFFQTEKNNDTSAAAVANDISKSYAVPAEVLKILHNSCYDCHSNNTDYPWYDNIQPVSWWLNHHISEGKRELNFNEFSTYSARRQYKKMEELAEEVKEGKMPLPAYTSMHKEAVLTAEMKNLLLNWAQSVQDTIKNRYPADSLIKR